MLEHERNDDGSPIAQISTTQILQSVLINTHTHILREIVQLRLALTPPINAHAYGFTF